MADEMLDEFVHEAGERLASATQHLLALVRQSAHGGPDIECINACFRDLHTVKGCAGFLDLTHFRNLAHATEQVLDAVRSGDLKGSSEVWDLLLTAVGRLEDRIAQLRENPVESPDEDRELLRGLDAVMNQGLSPDPIPASIQQTSSPNAGTVGRPLSGGITSVTSRVGSADKDDHLKEFFNECRDLLDAAEATVINRQTCTMEEANSIFRSIHTIKGMAAFLDQPLIEQAGHAIEERLLPVRDGIAPIDRRFIDAVIAGIDELRALLAAAGGGGRIGDALVRLGVPRGVVEATASNLPPGARLGDALVETGVVDRHVVEQAAQAAQAATPASRQVDGFSRVATAKLEEMVTTVGELLIAQAMVVHDPALTTSPSLQAAVTRQSRLLRSLQVLALAMRMVPLKGTFQKMARAVHDTARKLNKQVDFRTEGDDTEIDRTLAEAMADPLLHMVRNSVDHGIEAADVRLSRGKPEIGSITITAFHEGDDVVVRVSDDGGGMDPQRLRTAAIAKGVIPADRQLSDRECLELIFAPGFSTAAKVTDVSGRGVGMDVVRRQVQQANGTVTIESTIGQGSVFTIRLPLTTAILDGMLLCCGDERYLLPVASVLSMLRPAVGEVESVLGRGRVLRFRGQAIPVLALGEQFNVPGYRADPTTAMLLVVEHSGRLLAFQVDDVIGQRQVVIKPFDRSITHHPGVSGSAILGDGRVALILDPARMLSGSLHH